MTQWTLTNTLKKSAEEHQFWIKGKQVLKRIDVYRWGTFIITTENAKPPKINKKNPDGLNIEDCGYEAEMEGMYDGCSADYEWVNKTSKKECTRIEQGLEEASSHYDYLENDGWLLTDTEYWFYGPLKIEKVQD